MGTNCSPIGGYFFADQRDMGISNTQVHFEFSKILNSPAFADLV